MPFVCFGIKRAVVLNVFVAVFLSVTAVDEWSAWGASLFERMTWFSLGKYSIQCCCILVCRILCLQECQWQFLLRHRKGSCLLQVSFGLRSISNTLFLSATLMDLRLLEEDPIVPTTMITRGLRGPPTIPGGRTSRMFLCRTVNYHLYLWFMIVI